MSFRHLSLLSTGSVLLSAAALCALLLVGPHAAVVGQTQTPAVVEGSGDDNVTVEAIERLKAELEKVTEPDEPTRKAIEHCTNALAQLELAATARSQTSDFEKARVGAEAEIQAVRDELSQPPDKGIDVPADASLEQMRQLRDQATASLEAAGSELELREGVGAVLDRLAGRLIRLRDLLQLGLQTLDRLDRDVVVPGPLGGRRCLRLTHDCGVGSHEQ